MIPEWYGKRIVILGCGNVLFGDDGFGPAVAQHCLRNCTLPANVCVLDVGTAARDILFDVILSDTKPSKIVIVDAMDCGREPGELFSADIDSLPELKTDDFSLHELPTSNLLRELRDHCGIEITVLACQVAHTPQTVSPGLSNPVEEAVQNAVEMITREYLRPPLCVP